MQIINIKKELGGSYTYRRRRMSSIIFINPGRHHRNTPPEYALDVQESSPQSTQHQQQAEKDLRDQYIQNHSAPSA